MRSSEAMGKQSSVLDVGAFLSSHLSRRSSVDIGGLRHIKRSRRVEAVVRACGARLETGGMVPHYDPVEDRIVMPSRAMFRLRRLILLQATYALVLAHEAVHWTGHASRLARPRHQQRFDATYGREELIAELGSALICHDLGICRRPTLPHARYLNSYLRALPNAGVELDVALVGANQAVGYLMALARTRNGR